MTEVERRKKEIATLEGKKSELEKKQATNRQRMAQVKLRRSELVLTAAEGDQTAQREKRAADNEFHDLVDADETLLAALADVNAKLEDEGRELARAERTAVIAQLESEIRGLDALDVKVGSAIRTLKESTAGLFSACSAVAEELQKIDAKRFDGGYAFKLRANIRDEIQRAVMNVDKPPTAEPYSFIESVKIKLRGACAQLAYESLSQTDMVPQKGELLYKTQGWIGFRGIELAPGKLIALREDEAAPHLKTGFLVLEPTQAA